ncbi:hypothetical protein [Cohnella sp. GbtcB17]|uniref:hypothetical protein n=1 Tax=Cohnella sp. GbtcB17 TaxID=2824762 RepID=UPI001C2F60E5|nr:hypothetical protein [Cohnella sp. GbtcB17]
MMPMYKIRIIANACITRYNGGEREITDVVDSYNLAADDRELVLAEIYAKRPDIAPAAPEGE